MSLMHAIKFPQSKTFVAQLCSRINCLYPQLSIS